MINKIIKIQGIGLLHDAVAPAKKFSKINVIYGENGRGKSTFVNIFSSLINNNTSLIDTRKTLDGIFEPTIELLIDQSLYKFNNATWNDIYPNIAIFDTNFIDKNVYTGFEVSPLQRKALLEFSLGERGKLLKDQIDTTKKQTYDVNNQINAKKIKLIDIASPFSISRYLEIEPDAEIDQKIEKTEQEISLINNADEILQKPSLSKLNISFPDPERIRNKLVSSLSNVEIEAKNAVIEHMAQFMNSPNERWIENGMNLVKSKNCPFCGGDLERATQLIDYYTQYFNKSYEYYQKDLNETQLMIKENFSISVISKIEMTCDQNNSSFENIWKKMLPNPNDISFSRSVLLEIKNIGDIWNKLIDIKVNNPMLIINDLDEFNLSITELQKIVSSIEDYNAKIEQINKDIISKKSQINTANIQRQNDKLKQLKMIRERHISPNKDLCDEYQYLNTQKESLDSQKNELLKELSNYTNALFPNLEGNINRYLHAFGAGFRIVNVNTSRDSGYPKLDYKLELRNRRLNIQSSEKTTNEPTLSDVLSEGDKRTLAFSFFLAKLLLDPNLNNKIIIIDDPMSSLDQSRQLATQIELKSLAINGKQLILFSHDPRFLKEFLENGFFDSNDISIFELQRADHDYSIIKECNLEDCVQSYYKYNYKLISDYITDGQNAEKYPVARAIRPLIEENLRYRLQDSLKNADTLGKMIQVIRESQPGSIISKVKPVLPQLDAINQYTIPYGHGGDINNFEPQIRDAELKMYAKLALDFVRGF